MQQLFSHHQGVRYLATKVEASGATTPGNISVAASVTCQDELCTVLALKVRTCHASANHCHSGFLPAGTNCKEVPYLLNNPRYAMEAMEPCGDQLARSCFSSLIKL